jgi:DNA-binding NarL/FixJ family response regulator
MAVSCPDSASIRVLVCAPNRIYAKAIEQGFALAAGIAVVGSVAIADDVLDCARRLSPDVLVMDLSANLITRMATAMIVARALAGTRVLGLLPVLHKRHVELFLRSSITGLLDRLADTQELVQATMEVAAGRRYLSRSHAENLSAVEADKVARPFLATRESLTAREAEVLNLVSRGFTSREIGNRLFISHRTVENHTAELYRKLDLHDSRQLSCDAYQDEEAEPSVGAE